MNEFYLESLEPFELYHLQRSFRRNGRKQFFVLRTLERAAAQAALHGDILRREVRDFRSFYGDTLRTLQGALISVFWEADPKVQFS